MSHAQPGPWKRGRYGEVIDAKGANVLFTDISMSCGSVSEDSPCHANTHLLTAAPELKAGLAEAIAIIQDLYAWEPIEAQHDETGAIWKGERRAMPNRYYEIGNQAGVPPDEMAKKLEALFNVIAKATGA